MLDDLIKSMFLGGFFSEDGAGEDEAESLLKKALSEHKEPAHIFESAENVGLRAQILMLQRALAGFAEERELLAKEVRRLQQEISKFEEENTRLWHENERFQDILRRRDEEIAELQARISNLYSRMKAVPEADGGSSADEDADESSASAGETDKVGDGESAGEADKSPEAEARSSSASMSFCTDK